MKEALTRVFFILVVGLGAGLYYTSPNPITFGCMAADVFIGVWVMLMDVADRIRKG